MKLSDCKFSEVDHCYYYFDFKLEPTFGGFILFHRGKKVSGKRYSTEEVLDIIRDYIKGKELLTEEDMRQDYKLDKQLEKYERSTSN